MEITLWGVRGSIASPGVETAFYGGNTACIEVRMQSGGLFIFDAGSGLRALGEALPESGECHLFITHAHTDHIQGLGFFAPLHSRAWTTHLYLPEWLAHMPDAFFDKGLFPVPFNSFQGNIVRHSVSAGQRHDFSRDGTVVEALCANHPGGGLAFRLRGDDAVFAYSGDHEISGDPASRDMAARILRGADLAVVDAMYDRAGLRPGWGHSAWEDWLDLAKASDSRPASLILFHHDPEKTDKDLDALQTALSERAGQDYPGVFVGREGMRLLPPFHIAAAKTSSDWLERFLEELSSYKDESTILDRILLKARELANADAGTVFLAEDSDLVFAYTHNDSLFSINSAHKYSYSTFRLPVSEKSIAGYVAVTGTALNIANVRDLPEGAPYGFNQDFDAATGYVTRSMLTVPLFDHGGALSGVLQLINALDPGTKTPVSFAPAVVREIKTLAREAAIVLERNALLRKSIYRILNMASVHDPVETGPHAERVGSISAELYQRRADRLKLDPDIARHEKGSLRLAAMLHDIGKVGIGNEVLKKPGKLTDEEFLIMRSHTDLGAAILEADSEELPQLARDIAKHHHQKWDGSGYAGSSDAGRLAGEDIPLAARIAALADVFDALVSPRCYKEPWSFERAMDLLRKEAGKHFDPFLVECMGEITDLLKLIYERYPDTHKATPPGGTET